MEAVCLEGTEALMLERAGFASEANGGFSSGRIHLVTSLADSGPGSLRAALSQGPAWIVFAVSGTVELKSRLNIPSNVTIDGRGQRVRLVNYGLKIYDVENIIIHNLMIEDGVRSTTDAIEVVRSTDIWINHVSLANFPDGLLDIKYAPRDDTRITVSWSRFSNHNKTMMVGLHAKDASNDANIYTTVRNSYFAGTTQRNPRVAQGYAHLYNNVIIYKDKAVQSYDQARVLMESNHIAAMNPDNIHVTHFSLGREDIPDGYITAPNEGDNANFVYGNDDLELIENGYVEPPPYPYQLTTASFCQFFNVTEGAGQQTEGVKKHSCAP
ncbi:pectate lyase family protein [Ferrimonas balearica]|uniref:pectate lyase family protein n=1 Tax=Ferrimonas balearica TaxID=44012 RepID=UPI001C97E23D|nr:hypothetical protein [Ferrimonas balearica]MBY5981237.1 hypothetical protein [Ferrimonas balearica]